jgi:HD-like signal output (HDOD) protein
MKTAIKVLSPVVIEIFNIIDKPETHLEEVVNLVSLDRVLCANVFKHVNSAMFALRRPPENIQSAIGILGLYGLKDLIFILSVKGIFSSLKNWHENVFTAFCARKFAAQLNLHPKQCSDIYMAALMHNISGGVKSSYELLTDCGFPQSILNIVKAFKSKEDAEEYGLANALIDLAKALSSSDFIDEADIDELLSTPSSRKFNLSRLNISAKSVKQLYAQVYEFTDF